MKRSIASVCISGDLRQKIDAAAYAGFTGIEILENDLMMFDESPAVVRRIVEDAGMEVVALQPFRDFECMPVEKVQRNFDRVEQKFDVMEELGTRSLLFCSNVSPASVNNLNRAVDEYSELSERAKCRGFKLGYEALSWGRYIRDYRDAWELVRQVDRENFGIVLDSFHIFALGCDLQVLADIPANRIALVQLADAPYLDMDPLNWSRHFRCFPGQGNFPVVDFCEKIIKSGYAGYFSHEIFNDHFRSAYSRPAAVDGMRSMLWLEEQVAIRAPEISSGRVLEKPLPPKSSVQKVEFIEFAAEGEAKDSLVSLLKSLGFANTHKHKSKDVNLYKLDDVCVVVNEEPDSFAQNYFFVHGASVCALAFLADDAEGMLERCEYYGYKRFESNADSGEMELSAVQGIGGDVLYFVQKAASGARFYDVDFVAFTGTDAEVNDACGTMTIDHVASSLSDSEFLSTSLLLRAVFDLAIDKPLDLIDPYGIVVSRSAVSSNKNIRLPFNTSNSGRASSEVFREIQKGSGVQHIAISCADIFEYVKHVDQSAIVSIPDNYYVDISSKFDLDGAFVERLRKYNLLFDKSDTGDFVHFYTKSINGFFFEVVQRNSYANYGEMNAQVRMAAQARLRAKSMAE
ncbi:bifunctional sugar phosphate isomerase/epimerase/4-hydroxyphenylpyruvate dioxygenase family protein [Halioxenophilus sp. WMMB6]|uniref:bifunctional sugar phosphate isomerase/epimerase/4-hydroxyphenylpyruvate dioxygenase family protein n=1 Tax=Halioxenophilus sp. WMMB6 TaxID=3073815 RepID=UPI00295F4170|nr:TIM barrel protein [Halioxenophilus sp. WMMB6]